MRYKLLMLLITLQLGFCTTISAQGRLKYSEYGFGIGSLSSSNDIATTTSVASVLSEVRPTASLYAILHTNDWFGLGASVNYGWIYGEDANHSNVNRGFEFYTTLTQANAFMEFNFIRFGKYHRDVKFGLYSKLGGGMLAYNPNITFTNLQPENVQAYPDSYTTFNYFISFGAKFRTTYKSIMRVEVNFHNTGVDNLEGFEFRNNPVGAANDLYGGVLVSYSFLVF